MTRVILHGACGRMGHEVRALIENNDALELVASVDAMGGAGIYTNICDVTEEADVIIDFSIAAATDALLAYAVEKQIPVIIATTGHSKEQLEAIHAASEKVAVFHSANMSLGVYLLVALAKQTAAMMPDADIEIIETHHNRKVDAPSGTALMIANALKTVREKAEFVFGRQGASKRQAGEIGIHAVRRGNIVGTHEVIVSTDNQSITLKHEAHSRALFAEGAISAALFMDGKGAGLYDMKSVVNG